MIEVVLEPYLLTLKIFTPSSIVSIVDFEYVMSLSIVKYCCCRQIKLQQQVKL